MARLDENHEVKSAPFVDFVTYLPLAYDAIMNNPQWDDVQKAMYRAQHIVHINIIGRASDVSTNCPNVEDIVFSDHKSEWNRKDQISDWVQITLHSWKGVRKISYPMKLWRNFLDPKWCPVLAITHWLALSCLIKGPLFPNLVSTKISDGDYVKVPLIAHHQETVDNGKGTSMTVWKTVDGQNVNMHVDAYSEVLNTIFLLSGHKGATTHTIRRSAAQWAARCGAELYQILNAGRWKESSTSWQKYIKSGVLDIARFKGKDAIRSLWVFHPISFDESLSSLLS
jgi:hypothetical protein